MSTVRALLNFYNFSPDEFGPPDVWANWIMEAETQQLRISAGLQDRVAQWFHRPMKMDFSGDKPILTPIDANTVSRMREWPLFVVYSAREAEESGVVHASLRSLFDSREDVRKHMRELADLTKVFDKPNFSRADLADAMDRNFELRKLMLGAGVAPVNIEMVELARRLGFAAKQTGSGGAVLCLSRTDDIDFVAAKKVFEDNGFVMHRVKVHGPIDAN